jgi:hypothetical protein
MYAAVVIVAVTISGGAYALTLGDEADRFCRPHGIVNDTATTKSERAAYVRDRYETGGNHPSCHKEWIETGQ